MRNFFTAAAVAAGAWFAASFIWSVILDVRFPEEWVVGAGVVPWVVAVVVFAGSMHTAKERDAERRRQQR